MENATSPAIPASLGYYAGKEPDAVLGGFIGSESEKILGNISKTPAGRAWLTNQVMNDKVRQAMVNALGYNVSKQFVPGIEVDE
jgi:hypothetical protein